MREAHIMAENDDMTQNPLLQAGNICCYKMYWAVNCRKLPAGLDLRSLEGDSAEPHEEKPQERSVFSHETVV